jgi:hypothetical protein
MSRQIINNTPADSGLGDTLKVAFDKVNAMTLELYNADASFSDIVTEIDTTLDSLQTQINGKAPIVHTHVISQINGLQAALNGKVSTSTYITDMMAINSSIQAINDALNEITDILTQLEQDKVPYTGATRDVDLGAHSLRADEGFLSNWGNEGILRLARPFDSLTKEFVFYGGKADYTLEDQYCGIYATSEEGIYLDMFGQDGTDVVDYGLIVSSNNINFRAERGATNNYLTFDENQCYTTKKIITDEGFEGNYLQLNTAATEASAVGKFKWNNTDGTADLGLKGGNVTLRIGEQTVVRVVNKTGSLISKGDVVKVVQVTGGVTGIALAQANSDANSSTTIGIVAEDISNNSQGFIVIQGLIHEVNTNAFTEGDVLYLSPTTAGALTNVKPVAPQHMVIVGYVAKKGIADGHILLHVQNGYELDELHNVKISAATSGDVLTYNSTSQVWENKDTEYIKRQTQRVVETDFMVPSTSAAVQFPYVFTLINSGTTNSSILRNGINPGILRFRSSASANSGVHLLPLGNALLTGTNYISPNTQVDYIFRTPATIVGTGINLRFGLGQSASSTTDLDNGYYIEMIENTLYGKTADGSTRSQTPTSFTTAINTWYHGRVKYISTSLVEYSLYSMDGTLLWNSTLTTNITTNPLNPLIIAISTNASAIDLVINDYFSTTYPVSNRGALN